MKGMAQGWEFFEHTADIGVHVTGATLKELFVNAARAMYEALGKLEKSNIRDQKPLAIEAASLEDLLHDWLAELLYDLETERVLYDEFEIHELAPQRLSATLGGTEVDFARSQTNEEIKAVTYHQLRVEQLADGSWRATVIFDV
jgi:SHS2 domain-containing protein